MAATKKFQLTKYRLQMLTWAFYNHNGMYSITVGVGNGPCDGRIKFGHGYKKSADCLVAEGYMELVERARDKEYRRGRSVDYTVYTYRITQKGKDLLAQERGLVQR